MAETNNSAPPAATLPEPRPVTGVTAAPSVPPFARDYPADPRLDRIVALFEQGNFFQVRKDVEALLASTDDDAIRAAASELRARTEPDRLALYLIAAAAALLALLSGWYWTHPHDSAPAPSPSMHGAPGPIST